MHSLPMEQEEVQAYITHGVLSNGGMKTINSSRMDGATITDSIPQYDNKKVRLLSVGKLFAEANSQSSP